MDVIVLNADYQFLNFCNWKRALALVNSGKAEVLKASEKVIKNFAGTFTFAIPYVIKLVKLVRMVYKRRVPWSKRNVFIRDNNTCQYCGKENLKRPELEHVIPKSKGGKNTFENCVTACKECNRAKGDRTPSEAGMYLKKQPVQPTINEFLMNKLKNSKNGKAVIEDLFKEYY